MRAVFQEAAASHGARFHAYSQEESLKPEDRGVCLALTYAWLEEFYAVDLAALPRREYSYRLWEGLRNPSYFAELKRLQASYALPDSIYSVAFKQAALAYAQKHGFSSSARLSLNCQFGTNFPDFLSELIEQAGAQLFFLRRDHESDDHAIAIASRFDALGDLYIGVFDPSLGELIFHYHALELNNIEKRIVFSESLFQDACLQESILTVREWLPNLFEAYRREGCFSSLKCLTLRHLSQISEVCDLRLVKRRKDFSKALKPSTIAA